MNFAYNAREWLWMQQTFGIGNARVHAVMERYGTAVELLSLSRSRIVSDAFFTNEEKAALIEPSFAKAEEILTSNEAFGAAVLTPDSPEYPEGLRNIHAIPLVMYAQGDISLLREHYLVAMVGTRTPDEYGITAAKKLSGEIAGLGGVVVSGLAQGVDAVCHRAALEAGGKTVAFIGAGLDIDYPRRNRALRALIQKPQNGLVLTEYPLGTQAQGFHFPLRNRLISGASIATVIVQSRRFSGTMHTAGHALVQNRDLFAVPGSILSPLSEGCHHLLTQGAEPAVSGAEILLRYVGVYGYPLESPQARQTSLFTDTVHNLKAPKPKAAEKPAEDILPEYLTAQQAAVMACLKDGVQPVEKLCESLSMPAQTILPLLTGLELFGLIKMLPGRMATRCIS